MTFAVATLLGVMGLASDVGVLYDYVVNNGIGQGYIANINSPATGVASVPAGAQSVQVQLKRTDIPVFFSRMVGLSNLAAIGNATAIGPMPITTLTRGLFPVPRATRHSRRMQSTA
jgi:hypothetical protein